MPETIIAPSIDATETQPVVTALTDGRFVVFWTSFTPDRTADEIYGQGVSVTGELSGAPVLINTASANTQWEPDVAALPNNRTIVVFNDASGAFNNVGPGESRTSIVGRFMNPDGTGGTPFKIDQEVVQGVDYTFAASQQDPSVAAFSDGSFVVAWTDQLRNGGGGQDILVRRFDATGTPLGDAALANSTTESGQFFPSVSTLPDGSFFVAWRSQAVGGDDIRGRLFDADGAPTGPDFAVSTTPNLSQTEPETALLADGRIVVVWYEGATAAGRILNANGSWGTDAFTIGAATTDGSSRLGVDATDDGGFVVSWGVRTGSLATDVIVRAFDGTGTPTSEQITVNSTTAGVQGDPRVAVGADGKVLVVWASDDFFDPGPSEIRANLITLATNQPVGDVTFLLDAQTGVQENRSVGIGVGVQAIASDPDAANSVTFSLTSNPGGLFRINETTGRIEVGGPIDREAIPSGEVTVEVTATSSDGSTASASRTIAIFDADEFDATTPVDADAAANTVAEDAVPGALVGISASSSDADATTNAITYSLTNSAFGRFAIDPTTGVVTVAGALDFETADAHTITVQARSEDGSAASATFTIAVTDVPEGGGGNTPPVITSAGGGPTAAIAVDENTTLVTVLTATDPDVGQALTWRIAGGENRNLFTILDGALQFTRARNAESPPAPGATPGYQVVVEVADGAGGVDTQAITVTLADVNEFAVTRPADIDPAADAVAEDAAIGTAVGITASARDRDATTSVVSYSLTNDAGGRFAIDAVTGVVRTAAALDFETAPAHLVTVLAASADGSTATRSFTIAVADVEEEGTAGITRVGDGRANLMEGTARDDDLSGRGGNDTLRGFGGDDRLDGGDGADDIDGGAGDDLLIGGAGVDTVRGGDGDDTIVIRDIGAQRDVIDGGDGVDTLLVDATGGTVVLETTARITGVESFEGSGQLVRGTGGANLLDFSSFEMSDVRAIQGLGGADTLLGSAGGDTIEGGAGNDLLTGGAGDDTLLGDGGGDTFVYLAASASGADVIADFDLLGNDLIRFVGFGFGGAADDQARRDAVAAATTFDERGAEIDLDAIGGDGTILLAGVRSLSFTTAEDFAFSL